MRVHVDRVMLRSDRASVAIRRQVVLDTLREHPWATSRMLCDVIFQETGGRPSIITGSIHLPPYRMYPILRALEREGLVERRQFNARTVLWAINPAL